MGALFVLMIISTILTAGIAAQEDPCDPANHVEIDDPKRSTGYVTGFPETPLCDINLKHGWYRFTSAAGGELATTCPQKYQCGTHVPLWMKGGHPTVEDGIVTREVCGNYVSLAPNEDPCCDEIIPISVKNCGAFFVYQLSSTAGCPVSYCAGSGAVCPAGKWSPTLFPPCRDQYPAITKSPILHGPNIIGKTFHFECEIDYEPQDPEQVFEVTWVFDGEEDTNIAQHILTDPFRAAILEGSELYGHLPSDLQCKVRAYFKGNEERASNYLFSTSYFLGIQVSPARLNVSEQESFKQVIVSSSLPILCDDSDSCCLTLKLDTNSSNQIAVGHTCNYDICQEQWDNTEKRAVVEVPVVAKQDMLNDGNKQLLLTFRPLVTANGGAYMDIFYRHRPQQVQVVVQDQVTYTCSMTGDPHIAGFDYRTYHLYLVGDFIAYDVPEELFQVQIRTWPCGRVTCICGVAIRDKNDIIRINMCDQVYSGQTTSPIVDAVEGLRESTIVQRSEDGNSVGVYLPSGAEIRVQAYYGTVLNVYVTGPGTHRNKAKGICGTNDGVKENEFTHRDGTIDPICSDNDRNCRPDDFFHSWRVLTEENLFMKVPDRVEVSEEVEYCTCDRTDALVICDLRVNKKGTETACPPGCQDIKPMNRRENPGSRKKRDVTYEDVDEPDNPYEPTDQLEVDPNKEWSNGTGVTEDQARELCTKALNRSQLYSVCSGMNMAQSFMLDCMSDILFSGSTFFLNAITSAFTADCQLTLAKDPANYVSKPDGQSVMRAEYLQDICDLACDEHGECGQGGVCQCDEGWEGANCQIQSGIGPQLVNIRSGPLCDVAQRPCQKVFIDVTNIKLSDTLVCRLQLVDASGAELGPPLETETEFVSAYRISCRRYKTTSSSQHYRISASNDGDLFGNALPLHVFDSTCLDCTDKGCSEKVTACHINGVCYQDGAENPVDAKKICDVSKNTTAWTMKPGRNAATTVGPCMWELLIPFIGFLSICFYL